MSVLLRGVLVYGEQPATDVLIDDKPVPYARELWLPLVWFLIR